MRIFLLASLVMHLLIIYFFYSSERIAPSLLSGVEVVIVERVAVADIPPTDLESENIIASPYEKIQQTEVPDFPVPPPAPLAKKTTSAAASPAKRAAKATPVAPNAPSAAKVYASPSEPSVQNVSSGRLGIKTKYPRLSRMLAEEGRVIVLVHTNERGHVKKMSVAASSGFERLDEAALEAVSHSGTVAYDKNSRIKISFLFKLK